MYSINIAIAAGNTHNKIKCFEVRIGLGHAHPVNSILEDDLGLRIIPIYCFRDPPLFGNLPEKEKIWKSGVAIYSNDI